MALLPGVSVEIVRGCNLACPMCLTEREDEKVRRMPADLYEVILQQLRIAGVKTLRFCGDGEQTLHVSFPDYVAFAHASGIETVGVVTNGTQLLPPLVRKLFTAGLNFMAVSVDAATEPTYRAIRRGRHTLAQIEDNIMYILKCRQRWQWGLELQVNYVVQPLNVGEVEAFRKRWHGVVDQVNLLRLTSQTSSRRVEYGVLEPCYMLRRKLYISVDGDVYPCFYLYPPIQPLGNVGSVSLKDIWRERRARASRDPDTLFTPLCQHCTYTDQHWKPGTRVMPHDMDATSPLVSIRVHKNTHTDRSLGGS
jgi:radical SAM protein with 4Fe4S-binding SPASM domain